MSLIPTGAYINNVLPWWSQDIFGTPANIEVSTLTVNATPAGNILLENAAPLIFQRPVGDPNAPSESLVMISSIDVPTKLVNGQYITATKAAGTAYDDIAVQGLQIFGNQTTSGNSGAIAYITGDSGNLVLAAKNSVLISSLQVSSLIAGTIVSTTTNTATSYTATLFMSTPYLDATSISSINISTNTIQGVTGNFSTLNVSTLNAPSFIASTLSTISIDAKFTLTSTLSLTGNPTNIDLGLGDVIQGLVGGAATQALGAGLGGAGLITGAAALVTGRTSGGVNSNIFQTINGSTQLQFSTIGSAVSSVFLTTISPNPLTTPGLEISTTQGVPAGTYCVRSVGDPLYITNNVSSIQMFGQWVPVIQPTATASALAISSFSVSSINGATYPPPGSGGIPSTIALSSGTINGNFTQSGTGTFNWGGNTMSPTQVVLNSPTSVNNTLTTTGAAFLNASATINGGLNVASGNNNMNGSLTVNGGTNLYNGVNVVSGNLTLNQFGAIVGASVLAASQTIRSPALSTINISTGNINVSSVNGASYPPPGGGGIPSTLAISTATIDGNFTQSGTGTFNWGGNTMSPTQVVLNRPTSVNNTLTTSGGTFLNAGATINNGLIVASGGATITGGVNVNSVGVVISNGGLFVNNATTLNGGLTASGTANFNNQVNMLQNLAVNGSFSVSNGTNLYNGLNVVSGNLSLNQFGAIVGASVLAASQNMRSPALSTINISTGNINVSSVNGAVYPPGGGGGIPSTLNASTINVNGGQTITNGSLIVSGGISVVNGGLAVNSGNVLIQDPTQLGNTLLVSGLATLNGNLNTPAINTNTISTGSIVANAISTNTISSASLFISSINNAVYPPPSGGGIPSTLNASTLNVNGGQTITNGGLVVSGGNVTIQNPATMNNSLTILGQTAAVGGLVVEAPGAIFNGPIGAANTIQVAGLATLNGGARASFISTNAISSGSLLISSINNVSYPPPAGIPSTLNASTLNVNGGQTITNGGITISGGGTISDGGLWRYRMASIASAISFQQAAGNNDSLILDLKSDKTTRFYSTLLVRDSTWPSPQPSQSAIRTYDTTDPAPYGSVVTANVSTLNINISTINGATYPAPSPGIVPTGAITIWAGGSDGGSSMSPQNFAVPAGWLACDGTAVSQIVYNALYLVIGNKYSRGVTPPVANFFLPDLTFAVPMGTPYRNYFSNENLSKPNFQVQFQTWSSTYIDNPGYESCWKITQTIGGTLNLGTKFMGATISFGPWPNMYVTKILQYDGYQGYIIVRNENNFTSIPSTNGATLTATANGVVDRFPTTTGDYIYTLGTPGVFGRNNVTHNQTALESAVHSHGFGSSGLNGPSLVVLAGSIGGPVLPTGAQTSPPNTLSTISTIGTGPPGFPDVSNIGTYTAPNFINMLYIIKT